MTRRVHALAVLVATLSLTSCVERTSLTGLDRDYVLATTAPACANVTDILLRYEDDWLPGTCVGWTRLYDETTVLVQWTCRYDTNAGPTASAPIEGALRDPDGDGVFEGSLAVRPLPDVNAATLGPVGTYAYTLTPLP